MVAIEWTTSLEIAEPVKMKSWLIQSVKLLTSFFLHWSTLWNITSIHSNPERPLVVKVEDKVMHCKGNSGKLSAQYMKLCSRAIKIVVERVKQTKCSLNEAAKKKKKKNLTFKKINV